MTDDKTKTFCIYDAPSPEAIRQTIDMQLGVWDVMQVRRNRAALRAQLDEATLNAEWTAGHAMSLEQAVGYALTG